MNTCYIISAGDMEKVFPFPDDNDFIIAADAGYRHLKKCNITPNVTIGDFDSAPEIKDIPNVITYPVKKDDTDTMLAIKFGLDKGYKQFLIYGGLGGKRLDHTLANIQSLYYLNKHGAVGTLVGDKENITVITDSSKKFSKDEDGYVSVFSIGGKSTGVSIKGLLYPLDNADVDSSFPIGVSNHFVGTESEISVKHGSLVILWSGKIKLK